MVVDFRNIPTLRAHHNMGILSINGLDWKKCAAPFPHQLVASISEGSSIFIRHSDSDKCLLRLCSKKSRTIIQIFNSNTTMDVFSVHWMMWHLMKIIGLLMSMKGQCQSSILPTDYSIAYGVFSLATGRVVFEEGTFVGILMIAIKYCQISVHPDPNCTYSMKIPWGEGLNERHSGRYVPFTRSQFYTGHLKYILHGQCKCFFDLEIAVSKLGVYFSAPSTMSIRVLPTFIDTCRIDEMQPSNYTKEELMNIGLSADNACAFLKRKSIQSCLLTSAAISGINLSHFFPNDELFGLREKFRRRPNA